MSAVDQALDLLEQSTVPNIWRRDNPAEAEAIQLYREGETTGRPTARTKFGMALLLLIDASRVDESVAGDEPGAGLVGGPAPG